MALLGADGENMEALRIYVESKFREMHPILITSGLT